MFSAKLPFFLAIILTVVASCGPSAEQSERSAPVRFSGDVSDEEGKPVADTSVTLFDTGEFGITADDGTFDFESARVGSELELYLDGAQFSEVIGLGTIPAGTSFVSLRLKVHRATFRVESAVVEFSAREPLPTPEPTNSVPGQTPAPSLFDQNGNTVAFGIPSGIIGNINRGRSVWNGTCQSCHASEKSGRNFPSLRRALTTVPGMRALRITPQQAADVIAYLNRSRR